MTPQDPGSAHILDDICLKIGVTAHRDLSYCDPILLESQVRSLFQSLREALPELPLVMLNPLAKGGDMLVALVALDMGIPLEVPLPMPLELYEKDYQDLELLQEFRRLCNRGTVFELPMVDGNTAESIADQGEARTLQYAQLGMYIAAHSHLLLALWDGEASRRAGGTGSVVHFQLHDEMPGFSEARDAQQLLAENESDLVYHVHCPRSREVEQRAHGRWLTNTATYPGLELPERNLAAFKHMQSFRRDVEQARQPIEREGDSLLTDPAMEHDPALQQIDGLYRSADWLAVRYRRLVVRELMLTHGLAVLMGFSFITYSEYTQFFFLLPTFLLCFFTAWVLNKIADRRQWHRKYLDIRALAEGLRVQFYWTLADVEGSRSTAFAYDNLMQKQDVELVWIRHIMRGVSSAGRLKTRSVADGLELAIRHWIGDERDRTGQLGYYHVAAHRRARVLKRNNFYGRLTLWAGISIAVLLLFVGNSLSELPMNVLLIMMGMLPLMAAIREAYAYKKADKELTKQYQFMHKTFNRARQKLRGAPDTALKRKVLRALGEACLEEHSEWILLHRERPLEHTGLHA